MLPPRPRMKFINWRAPYKGNYERTKIARPWQLNSNYCQECVQRQTEHRHGLRLLSMIDLSILDFLIANWDRHDETSFMLWGANRFNEQVILFHDAFIITW